MRERPLNAMFLITILKTKSSGGALQATFFVIRPFLIHTYTHQGGALQATTRECPRNTKEKALSSTSPHAPEVLVVGGGSVLNLLNFR
jgi:hypothetical protein